MLFPTLDFGLFFLIVFAVSWELRERLELRKVFLLGASYFFYGYWDWRFMGLLAASSTINYLAGRWIARGHSERQRKWVLGVAVALNLGILGVFKYYGFFLDSLADLMVAIEFERDLPFLEIILPVGISFFTFQGISYIVDVYRRDVEPVDSIVDLFLYISFFPQLVAGPIVRAAHFLPQLRQEPRLDRKLVALGVVLILLGLFKKMVVANYLATELVDQVFFDPTAYSAPDLLLGVYAYAVQIYCDFSGYSDIAIGVAALLGYRFKWNFNQPYRAASLQEFWRRWHISLSTWLRDYLYKPLGGSKGSAAKTYRNLVLTMFLGGVWHGAAWTFVFWGLLHGGALAVERALRALKPAPAKDVLAVDYGGGSIGLILGAGDAGRQMLSRALGVLITFHVVCLGWILFRSESFELAQAYLAGLARWGDPTQFLTPFLVGMVSLSLACHFLPTETVERTAERIEGCGAITLGLILGLGILLIEMVAPEGVAPFIYFQF